MLCRILVRKTQFFLVNNGTRLANYSIIRSFNPIRKYKQRLCDIYHWADSQLMRHAHQWQSHIRTHWKSYTHWPWHICNNQWTLDLLVGGCCWVVAVFVLAAVVLLGPCIGLGCCWEWLAWVLLFWGFRALWKEKLK